MTSTTLDKSEFDTIPDTIQAFRTSCPLPLRKLPQASQLTRHSPR